MEIVRIRGTASALCSSVTVIIMRFTSTTTQTIAAYFALLVTSHGIINHLPQTLHTDGAPVSQVERQRDGLDRVLGTEFAGVASFPYWDHIGMAGMGSGVYLGDGRVLTSAHVGCFPFRMHDGSFYQPDYATWRILENKDGSKSDLAVFQVTFEKSSSLAKLGNLPIAEAKAERPILLIGTGFTQGAKPIVLGSQGKTLAVLGYHVQPQRSVAWGMNRGSQELDSPVATSGSTGTFSTRCFTTSFDRNDFAGQAADGDSGGAGFSFNRELGRWELAGCIIAVSQQQPRVTFGSRTFLGDLGFYAPQISGAKVQLVKRPAGKNAEPIRARAAAIR